MNNFKTLREYISNEIKKIDTQLEKYEQEEKEYKQDLEKLSSLIEVIETDIRQINIEELQERLSLIESTPEVENDIKKLKEAINLYNFLIDPRIPNHGVKEDILTFINTLKVKLNNYSKNKSKKRKEQREQEPKQLLALQRTYVEYLTLFTNEGFLNILPQEKMNEFFDFLENSDIDRNIVLDLITNYTKNLVSNSKAREQIQSDIVEKKIDDNAEKLLDELKNSIENSEEKEEDIPNEVVALLPQIELTEEEKVIKEKVEEIINQHKRELSKVGAEIAVQLFDKFTIDIRESLYLKNNKIDWDFVVADYEINLVKNLSTKKEEVFEIFKFIIQKNNEYIEQQKEQEENKTIFLELKKQLEDILKESEGILYDFSQKEPNVKNTYEKAYELIKEGNAEYIKIIAPHLQEIQIDEAAFIGLLKEIKDYLQILDLELDEIDLLDLRPASEDIKKYIEKYDDYYNQLKSKEDADEIYEMDPNEDLSLEMLDYDKTKNLILMCKNKFDMFSPLYNIYSENKHDLLEIKEYEFKKALECFSTRELENRKKELKSSFLYTNASKEKTVEDVYGVATERLRFSYAGRTGYVLIPVHEENRKKLREIYGDNIFSTFNSIPMIIGIITCGASHEDYKELVNSVKDNIEYIRRIINIFNNPNTDIKTLTGIIEESMNECQRYIKSVKERN